MGWTLHDQVQLLQKFEKYLVGRGVKPTRLVELTKSLQQTRLVVPSGSFDVASFARLRREAAELAEIFLCFRQLDEASNEFWNLMLGGVADPSDETRTDHRDRQYEVWLTAYLTGLGIDAIWEQDKQGRPDLHFTFNDRKFLVSAKRPKADSNFRNSVMKSIRDLRKWLHDEPGAVGLGAICLDHHHLSEGPRDKLRVGSTESLQRTFFDYWPRRKPVLLPRLQTKLSDEPVAGLLVTVQAMVLEEQVDGEERFTAVSQMFLDPLPEARLTDLSKSYWEGVLSPLADFLAAGAKTARSQRRS